MINQNINVNTKEYLPNNNFLNKSVRQAHSVESYKIPKLEYDYKSPTITAKELFLSVV